MHRGNRKVSGKIFTMSEFYAVRSITTYRVLLFFAVKKFHGLMSFLSFPEKLLRLPVTLPILGTLDSNIHRKTFAVTK